MSIKQRLILSNIAMIIIPIIGFFVIEIVLGYMMFVAWKDDFSSDRMQWFVQLRFAAMLVVLAATNGILTYYVSKSIITPIRALSHATAKISEGDLNWSASDGSSRRDELGELARSFEQMRLSLIEARTKQRQYEQNRQELVASISHDLKTPLTSIRGYVKGIQDGVANNEQKLERYLNIIEQTAERMDRLIDELLLYSKLDLQRQPLHVEPVELVSFFHDCTEELSYRYQLYGEAGEINLQTDRQGRYVALADRDQLKRAVVNLVDNSIKYSDKRYKKIEIHLQDKGSELLVEIKDNGQGIEQQQLPYIFESFYRADPSRSSKAGGSGLGLSIVRKIIEAHGGRVWASSSLHEGTSLYFTLKKEDADENDTDRRG